MKLENEVRLLTAIYLSSTLNNILDDITVQNDFVGLFKNKTNNYMKYLKTHIHSQLNKSYEIDSEAFESLDNYIHNKSLDFRKEILNDLFKIIS